MKKLLISNFLLKEAKVTDYINKTREISPVKESIIVCLVYGLFGFLWVLLSDKALASLISDTQLYQEIQTYKGWIYVLVTTLLIYSLVLSRMEILQKATNKILASFEQLSITHEQLMNAKEGLKHMAFYDMLTQLPNRTMFENEVQKILSREKEQPSFALIYMDVDNFKYINDSLGHHSGDVFLKYISSCFAEEVKSPDLVARLGGDEFAILVKEFTTKDLLKNKIKNLEKKFGKTWSYQSHEFFISFSIGIALYPEHGKDYTTLSKNADIAMYAAKNEGKGRLMFFQESMNKNNLLQVEMAKQLEYALMNEEFVLNYQPQFRLSTGEMFGMEALIRWLHPQKGYVSPTEFIPLAEETGQIYAIERWVVKNALSYKMKLEDRDLDELEISINLSSKTLTCDNNFHEIENLLSNCKIDLSRITIEITETAIIKDVDMVIRHLNHLKKLGVKIALDDFGTGYSSINYLKNLPIDIVKLDKNFVSRIEDNEKDRIIIKCILDLANELNFEIVAEGIETDQQLEYLKELNCRCGQGYLMSQPLSVENLEKKIFVYGKC